MLSGSYTSQSAKMANIFTCKTTYNLKLDGVFVVDKKVTLSCGSGTDLSFIFHNYTTEKVDINCS